MKKKTPTKPTRKSSERIGILGGIFNPVHVGHLNAALTVKNKLELDRVILIPSFKPPHREVTGPSPKDRALMLKAAIKPYSDELEVDDIELKRKGVSYTVDTLEAYNKKFKADNLFFIMGADAFWDFPRWKNFEKLIKLAHFVVVSRPGREISLEALDLSPELQPYVKASDRNKAILNSGRTIIRLQLEDKNVSSTEVRKKLRNNGHVRDLVPASVLEIIDKKGFYRKTSPLISDYREFAQFCARKAQDKKALALKVYDMTAENSYTDYSIICSATSTRHAAAVAQNIIDSAKEEFGVIPLSFEGAREGLWVLIDFGAVIIHVFEDAVRAQYNIENLWKNCPQIQDAKTAPLM